jgi:hypothetical protein
MRTVYRYVVPVDDRPHQIDLRGPLVAVGCRQVNAVEFWAIWDASTPETTHTFQVYGTGQPDVEGSYCGTAVAPADYLVWHLFELGGAS